MLLDCRMVKKGKDDDELVKAKRKSPKKGKCKHEGCDKQAQGKGGLCKKHGVLIGI